MWNLNALDVLNPAVSTTGTVSIILNHHNIPRIWPTGKKHTGWMLKIQQNNSNFGEEQKATSPFRGRYGRTRILFLNPKMRPTKTIIYPPPQKKIKKFLFFYKKKLNSFPSRFIWVDCENTAMGERILRPAPASIVHHDALVFILPSRWIFHNRTILFNCWFYFLLILKTLLCTKEFYDQLQLQSFITTLCFLSSQVAEFCITERFFSTAGFLFFFFGGGK